MARNKVKLTKWQFSRCDLLIVEDSVSLLVKRIVTTLRFYKVRHNLTTNLLVNTSNKMALNSLFFINFQYIHAIMQLLDSYWPAIILAG